MLHQKLEWRCTGKICHVRMEKELRSTDLNVLYSAVFGECGEVRAAAFVVIVDDLSRDTGERLVEGRVGEDGAASDNLDEHAVRVVVAREGCHEAVGSTVLFIGTAGTSVKRMTLFRFRCPGNGIV